MEEREKNSTGWRLEEKRRILILATGSKTGGGSGFQELVEFSRTSGVPVLNSTIVGVISNHDGGVINRANKLAIPSKFWKGPFDAKGYQSLVKEYRADFVMCSGWLKMVVGLDPAKTINVHPGPAPEFGGERMYGHYVHEAVYKAFKKGEITCSAVTMHFVINEYDRGPIFFELPVLLRDDDTPETIAERVNEKERAWQSFILNLVVQGDIEYIDKRTIGVDEYVFQMLKPFIPLNKVVVRITKRA